MKINVLTYIDSKDVSKGTIIKQKDIYCYIDIERKLLPVIIFNNKFYSVVEPSSGKSIGGGSTISKAIFNSKYLIQSKGGWENINVKSNINPNFPKFTY